jgi:hypothetical protein
MTNHGIHGIHGKWIEIVESDEFTCSVSSSFVLYRRASGFVICGWISEDSRRDARLPKQPGRPSYFPQILMRGSITCSASVYSEYSVVPISVFRLTREVCLASVVAVLFRGSCWAARLRQGLRTDRPAYAKATDGQARLRQRLRTDRQDAVPLWLSGLSGDAAALGRIGSGSRKPIRRIHELVLVDQL